MLALISPADVLGYGGAAGGGKTDFILGCALTLHERSIIFRREAVQLEGLVSRSRELIGNQGRYNGSSRIWSLKNGQVLEFGAVKEADDWTKYQGRPHDFIGFDEAANFAEGQVRALMGWNRTVIPGQRCRVVMGFNPPTSAEGYWIIRYFGPWLEPNHPHPARPGEVRWYASVDGQDVAVEGSDPFEHNGKTITPQSRSFIPARVEDNPYLMATGYAATLEALPEPLRSMMRDGSFTAGHEDHLWQVIPTAWVEAAQARWTADCDKPMDAVGVDPSRGGRDQTVIAKRHGHWFAPLKTYAGMDAPDGPTVAGLVVPQVKDRAVIHVDVIGIGASVYDHLKGIGVQVVGINGAEGSDARDKSGRLRMANKRAEVWWRMREALEPDSGQNIALPPDPELKADLCAPRWTLSARGVLIEDKDDIIKRIGRSPDRGDAVVYAHVATPKQGTFSGSDRANSEFSHRDLW